MMGWRIKTNGPERDAVSRKARHIVKAMGKTGVRSRLKRGMRRRARALARSQENTMDWNYLIGRWWQVLAMASSQDPDHGDNVTVSPGDVPGDRWGDVPRDIHGDSPGDNMGDTQPAPSSSQNPYNPHT